MNDLWIIYYKTATWYTTLKRRKKLLDDLKERRGYPNLKEEALDRTMWRVRFGRGFGPVVRQTAKWMKWADLWLRWTTLIRGLKNSDSKACQVFNRSDIERAYVYLFICALLNDVSTSVMTENVRNGSKRWSENPWRVAMVA